MKTRRERLLAVLLMVLCVYALTLSKSISEAITTMLFDSNSEEIVIAASKCQVCVTSSSNVKHTSCSKATTSGGKKYCCCGSVIGTVSTSSPKPTSTSTTTPKPTSTSHTCSEAYGSYAGWYANSSIHYTKCKTCGKTMRSGSHSKKNANDTSCRTCGYSMPASTTSPTPTSTSHTCSEAYGSYAGWYANSSIHYTKCKTCGKTMRSASHSKSSASATSCRACGYSMPASTTSPTPTSTTTPKPTSTTSPSPSSHIHIGSQNGLTDWSHSGWWVDSEGHYVVCKTCGIPMMALNSRATGKNAHYDRNKDGKCDGCGYVMGTTTSPSPSSHIHIGSQNGLTDWSYSGWWVDTEGHYVKCKTCGTPMMGLNSRATGKNAHYDRNKDGKCDGCGYVIGSSTITNPGEHVHTIKYGPASSNGWFSDGRGHYMRCTGCDATLKYSNQNNTNSKIVEGINAHVLNKNTGKCTYCYYSMKGTTTGSEKTYTITTKSYASKGVVTASQSTAKAGETITITATASAGYKFSSWNYSKAADKKQETTTFVMPSSNVTISARFVRDNSSNNKNHEHIFGIKYYNNYDGTHYKKCTVRGCSEKSEPEKHDYLQLDRNGKPTSKCICGKLCPHPSTELSDEWYQSTTQHYKLCKLCLAQCKKVNHKYNLFSVCNTCKYIKGSTPLKPSTGSELKYTVKVSDSLIGGEVTVSSSEAKAGETIKITAKANDGYKFDSWNYTGAKDKKSSTTTFIMPKSNVIISANFVNTDITDHEHAKKVGRIGPIKLWNAEGHWYQCVAKIGCDFKIEKEDHTIKYK